MKEQVLMAMSGGVDSSVAAAMLQDEGYEVIGVTMKLWGGDSDSGCCSISDVEDARRVADQLGIEHHVFIFGDEFNEFVVDPYVQDHSDGRTPNPCVECNRHIKFDKLYQRADELGIDKVATGHHAAIEVTDAGYHIARGADEKKDQSYVLYMLDQAQLKRLLLPLGITIKDKVREMASEIGLRTAAKADSQDVCFIHSVGGRQKFLGERIPLTPAKLVDENDEAVGEVESIELVTLGQRRGLNLGGDHDRRYVVDIDRKENKVEVGPKSKLLIESQPLSQLVWTNAEVSGEFEFQCAAHAKTRNGRIQKSGDGYIVTWEQPQPRVAAGQSIVMYQDNLVVGGALAEW